jgi:hypothetical protein
LSYPIFFLNSHFFLNFFLLIDEEAVKEQLLPGLKLLQRDSDHMEAAYKSMITTMITEFEATIKSDASGGVQTQPGSKTAPATEGFGKYFTRGVADIKKKGKKENSWKILIIYSNGSNGHPWCSKSSSSYSTYCSSSQETLKKCFKCKIKENFHEISLKFLLLTLYKSQSKVIKHVSNEAACSVFFNARIIFGNVHKLDFRILAS